MRTPVDVVTAAFAAINLEDWHTFIGLCDPLSLAVFKRQTVRYLGMLDDELEHSDDPLGLEGDDSSSYSVEPEFLVRHEIAGARSVDDIREMDPGRVFVRWIQARSFYRDRDLEDGRGPEKDEPDRKRNVVGYRYAVLGSVPVHPSFAYVLACSTDGSPGTDFLAGNEHFKEWPDDERRYFCDMCQRSDPLVVECRRIEDGSWRIVARRSFFVMDSLEAVDG